jgi:hypothetical protein
MYTCEYLHSISDTDLIHIAQSLGVDTTMETPDIVDAIVELESIPSTSTSGPVLGAVESMGVKQLKELAKSRGIPGYYKMKKDELVSRLSSAHVESVIQETPSGDIGSMNVKQLKELAKSRGIPGYYKMKKDELVSRLSSAHVESVIQETPSVSQEGDMELMNVKQLKELAKSRGIPGYYKLKRSELLSALHAPLVDVLGVTIAEEPEGSVEVSDIQTPEIEYPENIAEASLPAVVDAQESRLYIDDILREIQVTDVDKYLRNVSSQILKCLAMY